MGGMIDWRCKCGKRFGWRGGPKQAVPCPRCGAMPDVADLEAVEAELEKFRREILSRKEDVREPT